MGENASSGSSLVNIAAVIVIIAAIVVTDNLLLGIVALLLFRILDVLIDIRDSLGARPDAATDSA